MKTIVKIDPEKEYGLAKKAVGLIASQYNVGDELATIDGSIDNLKTVINVLIERQTPKKRIRPPKKTKPRKNKDKNLRKDFDKLPSEKFPDLDIDEHIIPAEEPPQCPSCSSEMKESGLYKCCEKLDVVPKKYYITRNKRVIYNCSKCHGSMVNAPRVPSISRSSNYGDSLIIDASLSKYCDLIPMERYSAMAAREGLGILPPNSLISLSHHLASFLTPLYEKIKQEVLNSEILLADETPHKMLEGDNTANWYLWGFSSSKACFFEAHGTRSGAVPYEVLEKSDAEYLLTDGYSGYKKALKDIRNGGRQITEVYCNAHAFRYFVEAQTTWESETKVFLKLYGEIYDLERQAENTGQKKYLRQKMIPLFKKLKVFCEKAKEDLMPSSTFEKAVNYFLNHYIGLTAFLKNINIPLDNNFSERLLRSPVVGRKTWLGTHSKRGARTSSVLFSLVESCKINKINPRNYFHWATDRLHAKQEVLTPYQYGKFIDSG